MMRLYPFKLNLIGSISLGVSLLMAGNLLGQSNDSLLSSNDLKMMSLDELMNVEVTSISNTPQKISEVPSAIQVISNEEILRSSAVRLPEAVSLATNLQSSRVTSHDYGITARGFNGLPSAGGLLANKLLVLNDGRSLYTPLLGGVYWDAQNMILEDIDRIEVVSGPGGTLWGANAVNGVINIVSKSAEETQGLYLSSRTGTFLDNNVEARYGFKVGENTYMRVYGQFIGQKASYNAQNERAGDNWENTQGGFRLDYNPNAKQSFTLQGDGYMGISHQDTAYTRTDGQNLLGRFTQKFSKGSDLRVQMYLDRVSRLTPNYEEDLTEYVLYTVELDIKYRKPLGERHNLMVGGMYRFRTDETAVTSTTRFRPRNRSMPLTSFFVQDEWSLVPKKLQLTYGSKVLNNVFTGVEFQPSARIAYNPKNNMTIWGAVSRAVRVPSRFDADITGGEKKFEAEYMFAHELGFRMLVGKKLSFSLATFYNKYESLRSLDINPDFTSSFPTLLANSQNAESWGAELSGNYTINENWRLRGGYTYFGSEIWSSSPLVLEISEEFEALDPAHTVKLQSISNIGKDWQFDFLVRYSSLINVRDEVKGSVEPVKEYTGLDVRIAKSFDKLELSVVGKDLIKSRNQTAGNFIPRSLFIRIKYSL